MAPLTETPDEYTSKYGDKLNVYKHDDTVSFYGTTIVEDSEYENGIREDIGGAELDREQVNMLVKYLQAWLTGKA